MKIPPTRLVEFLDRQASAPAAPAASAAASPAPAPTCKIHSSSGHYLGSLPLSLVRECAGLGLLSAIGSLVRIRYCVPEGEAAGVSSLAALLATAELEIAAREPAHLAEFRSSASSIRTQASITWFRERIRTQRGSAVIYQHKGAGSVEGAASRPQAMQVAEAKAV